MSGTSHNLWPCRIESSSRSKKVYQKLKLEKVKLEKSKIGNLNKTEALTFYKTRLQIKSILTCQVA